MSGSRPTILLVDDDAALLRGLTRAMAEEDFVVLPAVSAAEATAFLQRMSVDVVVCDQRMPGLTGIDFLSQLRRKYPLIKMIMLSGHVGGLPVAIDAARGIGVHCILNKPCSADELSRTIRNAIESPICIAPQSQGGSGAFSGSIEDGNAHR
jgi:DNA-binding NtrC family response regulator